MSFDRATGLGTVLEIFDQSPLACEFKKCLSKGLLFTLTAHDGTTGWKSRLESSGVDWKPWEYSDKDVEKANKRDRKLEKIEVGRIYWSPSWSEEKLLFPIVIKRTWRDYTNKTVQGDLFAPDTIQVQGEWEYYAVVTNLNLSQWSLQEVMKLFRETWECGEF